jgi:hypothetical protein
MLYVTQRVTVMFFKNLSIVFKKPVSTQMQSQLPVALLASAAVFTSHMVITVSSGFQQLDFPHPRLTLCPVAPSGYGRNAAF